MSATPAAASAWTVESRLGDAAFLHGVWPLDQAGGDRDGPGWHDKAGRCDRDGGSRVEPGRLGRRIAVCSVVGAPALVLGSTQGRWGPVVAATRGGGPLPAGAHGVAGACATSSQGAPTGGESPSAGGGASVVRRRGGGGAVLVAPGAQVWVDVWIPRFDPLWDDDVVRSARWVGDAWATAIDDVGLGPATVHDGSSVAAPWSAEICFAGIGPGEVRSGSPQRKVMGLTQHRTRHGVRFQTMALARWEPAALVRALVIAGLVDPSAEDQARASVSPRAVGLVDLDDARRAPGSGPGTGREVMGAVEAAVIRRLCTS
ncbi:MAG: hypothetical protein M0Z63_14260 [Actinomycetota bacterium]|nr:hypothetical protein [Actinomycetota bacterium]MDA8281552.1 hypothetical protein [Actinomycetota bacterium]